MWFLLILILIVFIFAFYLQLTWNFNYWKDRNVPGQKPQLIFGSFPESMKQKLNIVYEIDEIYKNFKSSTPFVGVFASRFPQLLITDPEIMKNIFLKDFKHFEDNDASSTIDKDSDPLFGRNPFILCGEEWKAKRAEISPAFTLSKVKGMYSIIENVCDRMNANIAENLTNGSDTFDAKELSSKYTIDVVSNCIYAIDSKALSSDHSIIHEMSKKLFHSAGTFMKFLSFISIVPSIQYFYRMPMIPKEIEIFFRHLLQDAITLRQKTNATHNDYLSNLIELQKKKGISHLDMAAHSIMFFLDGYETANSVIAHMLYLLAGQPNIQTKLRTEINETFSKSLNGRISFDDIHNMEYLDLVFYETLRLFPPAPVLFKKCTIPITLNDYKDKNVLIEKDMSVIVSLYSLNRDSRYYPEPDKFYPERFLSDENGVKGFRDKGLFFPFGDGPRFCIGMKFAIIECKAAIVEILKNFDVLPSDKMKEPYIVDPTKLVLQPVGGLWIKLRQLEEKE